MLRLIDDFANGAIATNTISNAKTTVNANHFCNRLGAIAWMEYSNSFGFSGSANVAP